MKNQNKMMSHVINEQISSIDNKFKQFLSTLSYKNHPNDNQIQSSQQYLRASKISKKLNNTSILRLQSKFSQDLTLQKIVEEQDIPLIKNNSNRIRFINDIKSNFNLNKHNQGLNDSIVRLTKDKVNNTNRSQHEHIQSNRYHSHNSKIMSHQLQDNQNNVKRVKKQPEIVTMQTQKMGNSFRNYSVERGKRSECKLNISRIANVIWNPQNNELSEICPKNIQQQAETFLLSLLKIDTQKAIEILTINLKQMSGEISGKKIFSFFNVLFKELNILSLAQPLVKKFNNCIYYGQKTGLNGRHSGIISYNNGNVYFGQLNNFKKHGQGIQIALCKNVKESSFVLESTHADSYMIFKGNYYKNTKSGNFLIQAEDFLYQGELVKGYLHGKGKLITKKLTFEGAWEMNQKIKGKEEYRKEGLIYEGQYKQGLFHGKGKLKSKDQLYEGDFNMGLKHGHGIIVNCDYIYEGMFKYDKKSGSGFILDKKYPSKQQQQGQNTQANKMFTVKFEDDHLIHKSQFIAKIGSEFELQTLETFPEREQTQINVHTVLSDGKQQQPTKILMQSKVDRFLLQKGGTKYQQDRTDYQCDKTDYNRIFLNITPKQPQQQLIYQKNGKFSYLQGNKRNSMISSRQHPLRN